MINFWGPWTTVEEITPAVKDAVDQAIKELARKRQANESAGMPSTEDQVQPEGMSRAPPIPLHRSRPPPSPKMPAASTPQAPPPPNEESKPRTDQPQPPPPPKGDKIKVSRPPPSPPRSAPGSKDNKNKVKNEL